jgi:hypothetical protein
VLCEVKCLHVTAAAGVARSDSAMQNITSYVSIISLQ